MPVELRKRPPPKETATPAPASKRGSGAGSAAKKLADKAKAAVTGASATATSTGKTTTTNNSNGSAVVNGKAATTDKISVGQTLNLDGFGGTIQTNDGADTTLKDLLEKSGAGIVIFTYPRASTPGCKFSFPSSWCSGLFHFASHYMVRRMEI